MYKFINRQTFNADKRVLPNRVLGNWSVLSFSYPLGCFLFFFFYYYYFIFASQIGRKLVDVKRSRTGRIEFLGRLRHPPPRIRFLGSNRQKNWLQSLNYFILELSFEPNQMVSFFFCCCFWLCNLVNLFYDGRHFDQTDSAKNEQCWWYSCK